MRGTPHDTGEVLAAALRIGAAKGGDWASAHSVQWDAWHPDNEGNRELTNRLTRQSYPLGIIVNRDGRRFVDEGADFRNYTYARYGRAILEQPGSIAFQLFDGRLRPLLRAEEYDMPGVSVVEAPTVEELARRLGVDAATLATTVDEFNASIDRSRRLRPDGQGRPRRAASSRRRATGRRRSTSRRSTPTRSPAASRSPSAAFAGRPDGRVLDQAGQPIPGLYVCGEMLGGLFSGNYPGGSGLAAGMVFGWRAGRLA